MLPYNETLNQFEVTMIGDDNTELTTDDPIGTEDDTEDPDIAKIITDEDDEDVDPADLIPNDDEEETEFSIRDGESMFGGPGSGRYPAGSTGNSSRSNAKGSKSEGGTAITFAAKAKAKLVAG
jgi:hypothetical protein